MPEREHVVQVLLDLIKRIENEELAVDYDIESFDYLYGRGTARTLVEITGKLDRLLEYGRCRLSGTRHGNVIELITGLGPTARSDALNHLRNWLGNAENITVCDPFFFKSIPSILASDYVASIDSVLPLTIRTLEIFSGGNTNQKDKVVVDGLKKLFVQRNINVIVYKTNRIHDRVWIKSNTEAYSVGTSFNGLGNKCAFILPLPIDDLRNFLAEIQRLRVTLHRSITI